MGMVSPLILMKVLTLIFKSSPYLIFIYSKHCLVVFGWLFSVLGSVFHFHAGSFPQRVALPDYIGLKVGTRKVPFFLPHLPLSNTPSPLSPTPNPTPKPSFLSRFSFSITSYWKWFLVSHSAPFLLSHTPRPPHIDWGQFGSQSWCSCT